MNATNEQSLCHKEFHRQMNEANDSQPGIAFSNNVQVLWFGLSLHGLSLTISLTLPHWGRFIVYIDAALSRAQRPSVGVLNQHKTE